MLEIRKSGDRGHADHGWLQSKHSFSFASYYDPDHTGFGPLLVINDDRVAPGQGFGTHGHRDMEIISYVLEGALAHQDSTGAGSVLRYGDVQRMSAGSGVRHSEFNASDSKPVHFLQIWIAPKVRGVEPSYEEWHFPPDAKRGRLRLIASNDGRDGSLTIHQDACVYASIMDGKDDVEHMLARGHRGYVHVIRGSVVANGITLMAGDALKLTDEAAIRLAGARDAELLVFDLPH